MGPIAGPITFVFMAAFVSWLTGLVSGFWATLGVLSVPLVIYWADSAVRPASTKIANGLSIFGVVWTALFFLIPVTMGVLEPIFPMTSQYLVLARKDKDLKLSQVANPDGYEGRLGYTSFCESVARADEEKALEALENLKSMIPAKDHSIAKLADFENREREIRHDLERAQQRRRECSKWVVRGSQSLGVHWKVILFGVVLFALSWVGSLPGGIRTGFVVAGVLTILVSILTMLFPDVGRAFLDSRVTDQLPSLAQLRIPTDMGAPSPLISLIVFALLILVWTQKWGRWLLASIVVFEAWCILLQFSWFPFIMAQPH